MAVKETIEQIALGTIYPHPANRRVGGFDEAGLIALADSIRAVGVQQPAVVRPRPGGGYELVAGERRWRAYKVAGIPTLPCVVRELDDLSALKVQTIENLQREDVHPLDEADGYGRLMAEAGYDVEQLASEIGKSESYVYQRLKLKELVEPARALLVAGTISAGHGILLARLQPADQKKLVRELTERSASGREGRVISVRELDDLIHRTVLLELSRAPFQRDDGELLQSAGACIHCPKRTGSQGALFADVYKQDYCTDPACFRAKLDALVARRKKDLAAEGGELLEVVSKTASSQERRRLPNGIVDHYGWRECKQKEPGAVRVLITVGPDRGRLTWGTMSGGGAYRKTPQEKAREAKEREAHRSDPATRKALYDEVLEKLEAEITRTGNLPLPFLRAVALRAFDRVEHNSREELSKMHGAERPPKERYTDSWQRPSAAKVFSRTIEGYGATELQMLLVKCLLVHQVIEGDVFGDSDLKLTAAVKLLGMDPEAIKRRTVAGQKRASREGGGRAAAPVGKRSRAATPAR